MPRQQWRLRALGALGVAFVGLLAALALTGALQPRGGAVELLDSACEEQMAAAASALGWSSVEAYKKNLRAEGKPVGCAVPAPAPAARLPQMRAPSGAKPHPVQQHSDNIIKWMFGDLFDDHASHSLHPTALHLAGKPFKAKEAPKPAAPVVLRADGSRVHRTAAEKMYDREQHELRVEEREERRYRQERQEHAVRGDERRSEMELEEAKVKREEAKVAQEREVLKEREARVERTERREEEERQELREEEAKASERAAVPPVRGDAEMGDDEGAATKTAQPTRELVKAFADVGDMWSDHSVPMQAQVPVQAQVPAQVPVKEALNTQAVEAVKTMAEEAKALGYKLVPAGLSKEAKEMGYNLVPRSAAPAPAGDGVEEGGSEMSMSHPGMLEALAERDVEHQLAELTMSPTAKRLEQQVCRGSASICGARARLQHIVGACMSASIPLKALETNPVFTSSHMNCTLHVCRRRWRSVSSSSSRRSRT
jgi:hypothetical protein